MARTRAGFIGGGYEVDLRDGVGVGDGSGVCFSPSHLSPFRRSCHCLFLLVVIVWTNPQETSTNQTRVGNGNEWVH